jgi:small subunit ribosomal protein S16
MNEPADGATTMKKKAAEKLAAKAAPAPEVVADVQEVIETPVVEAEAVLDVQAVAETVEAEVPASVETNATETPETSAEAAAE